MKEQLGSVGRGGYRFDGLSPGTYYVQVILPEGYRLSLQNQGDDHTRDSDAVADTVRIASTLMSGEHNTTSDAGLELGTCLAHLTAVAKEGQVIVTWGTLVENNVIGFHVDRSAADAGWTQITDRLIPATGGTQRPQNYRLVDDGAPVQADLYYRLVEVTRTGRKNVLGEVPAQRVTMITLSVASKWVSLTLRGAPRANAVVETASSVVGPWIPLKTLSLDQKGLGEVDVERNQDDTAQFYRAIIEP